MPQSLVLSAILIFILVECLHWMIVIQWWSPSWYDPQIWKRTFVSVCVRSAKTRIPRLELHDCTPLHVAVDICGMTPVSLFCFNFFILLLSSLNYALYSSGGTRRKTICGGMYWGGKIHKGYRKADFYHFCSTWGKSRWLGKMPMPPSLAAVPLPLSAGCPCLAQGTGNYWPLPTNIVLALKQSWDFFFLQYCDLTPLITVEDRQNWF